MTYTPVTVALFKRIRTEQDRKLHQARHLWLTPAPQPRSHKPPQRA